MLYILSTLKHSLLCMRFVSWGEGNLAEDLNEKRKQKRREKSKLTLSNDSVVLIHACLNIYISLTSYMIAHYCTTESLITFMTVY